MLGAITNKYASIVANAQFIGGSEISLLESRLKDLLQVSYAVTCANGTDALQLALRAMGVGPGDTVLVPNVTFWATFEAVINVGAEPMTADIDIADGAMDYTALEEAIVFRKPKAVILVHLYGWGSRRLAEIRDLCRREEVMLLEDGAQCYGVAYRGEAIYKNAFVSTTSFYPAKVLGGAGDGGAVFTNDSNIADRLFCLRDHGRKEHYGYGDIGWNSRLDALQAAFLNIGLEHIDSRIASRRSSAAYYRKWLSEVGVETIAPPPDYIENGYCNVCLIHDLLRKSTLENVLKASDIGFGNIYPGVLSKQRGAKQHNKKHFGGKVGEDLCLSVVNLPLFPYMTDAEHEHIRETVVKALQ